MASSPRPRFGWRLVRGAEWAAMQAAGALELGGIDARDGYVHMSPASAVRDTAALYFAGAADLWLLQIGERLVVGGGRAESGWHERTGVAPSNGAAHARRPPAPASAAWRASRARLCHTRRCGVSCGTGCSTRGGPRGVSCGGAARRDSRRHPRALAPRAAHGHTPGTSSEYVADWLARLKLPPPGSHTHTHTHAHTPSLKISDPPPHTHVHA